MESTLVEMLRQRECKPDVWTMNSTLRAFGGSGQIETMEKCYEKFLSAGIQPNIKTFNILLDSYGKTGNYKKMSAVMEYMQKYYFKWTLVTYNIVIDAFGRAGDVNQMEFLFRLMQSESIKPNWVLPLMESKGCLPDKITYRTMIKAYNMNGMSNHVKELRLALSSVGKPDSRR
nr:hypothetical protein [Tanacetum cinerariifolium]